ncbi:MAG TPA: hypothetical protein VF157_03640 [Chloroflexota bacterium]
MNKLWIRIAAAVPLFLLATVPATADSPPPSAATVVMTDLDYQPRAITIAPGGMITWNNQGSSVHSAVSLGGAPLPFNTGGVGPGQSTILGFWQPGAYYYTSATDCQNGNSTSNFPCNVSFLVNVTSASVVATAAAATVAALPSTPTPTATPVPANLPQPVATVVITDQGVMPSNAIVALNGSVTFVNEGSNVHTVTSPGNASWPGFDSGGIGRGQAVSIGFAQAGAFNYSSVIDCPNGISTTGFKCGPYSITVSNVAPPAPPPSVAATPLPTSVPPLAAPNPNTNVGISDLGGFTPSVLTIKAGQTVSWTNNGMQPNTVTSDAGYVPAFDSGGMTTGQKFSVTFTTPGSFGYHSQTNITYFQDAGCGCTAANYVLRGLINVTP